MFYTAGSEHVKRIPYDLKTVGMSAQREKGLEAHGRTAASEDDGVAG